MEKNIETVSISTGTIIRFLVIGLLVGALFLLRDVVLILITSIVIASFVQAVVRRLARWHIPRALVVILVYALTLILGGLFLYFFVPVLFEQLTGFVIFISPYISQADILNYLQLQSFADFQDIADKFSGISGSGDIAADVGDFVSAAGVGFLKTTSVFFGGIVNIILIAVISFYFSIQEKGIEQVIRIITPIKHEDYIIGLWHRTERKIGLWTQGQLLLAVIMGLITYLGLLVFGLNYALLVALFASFLSLIPFGFVLAVVPALIFAYVQGGVMFAAGIGFFYIAVQQLENYVINPLVSQRIVGIPPVVVILALLIGAKLAGLWGIVISVPIAVAVLEFTNDIEQKKIFARSNHG